jgi:hypothetical protein
MDVGLQKCLTGGLRPAHPDAPFGTARRHVLHPNTDRIRPRDRVSSGTVLPRHSALRPQGWEFAWTLSSRYRGR